MHPRSRNLLDVRVAFLASPGPALLLDHDASLTSSASPREIPEHRIDYLLKETHSRLPLHVVAAAPGTLHMMSFLDLLSSYCFNPVFCNFGHQSPLLDVQSNCQNPIPIQSPIAFAATAIALRALIWGKPDPPCFSCIRMLRAGIAKLNRKATKFPQVVDPQCGAWDKKCPARH